jgi:hypothetical protein
MLNVVDPRARADVDGAGALLRRHGGPCFEAAVRRYRAHERGPLDGLVDTSGPVRDRYSLRALDDYRALVAEILTLGRPELLRPQLVDQGWAGIGARHTVGGRSAVSRARESPGAHPLGGSGGAGASTAQRCEARRRYTYLDLSLRETGN